jgi:8-amino-7-oxononanoate synthase
MTLHDRWRARLDALDSPGRLRTLQVGRGVDFASNDYLGHGRQPPDASNLPLSGTASRLLRGHHAVWEEVEDALARWHGAEAALVLTSGYVANEGLLSTLIEPDDWVASDALNHASVIDGLRLARAERFVYRHLDLDHLEAGLRAARHRPGRHLFIVTESLFSMEGDVPDLQALVDLADRWGAGVVVDEAHATGCLGPGGTGLVDQLGLRPRVLATVHTGGKALAVTGAYVCVPALLRQLLVNRCRHFIFTTALPPAVGAWWLRARERVAADDGGRARLRSNHRLLREELQRNGVAAGGSHYVVPVLLGDDRRAVAAAARLQERGYDVRAIRPPSVPAGTSRLRLSVHADHDDATLRAVAAAVAEVVR